MDNRDGMWIIGWNVDNREGVGIIGDISSGIPTFSSSLNKILNFNRIIIHITSLRRNARRVSKCVSEVTLCIGYYLSEYRVR